MRGELFVKIITVVIIFLELMSAEPLCDMEVNILLDEGNMGRSSDFNWLGILQVFLSDGDAVEVAVTGLVLVKANRALASADDVVRIPKRILLQDSRALFISAGDSAGNYSVLSYVTHPEYQADTVNSFAIILLDIGDNNPLVPVCFPKLLFDTDHLYLTGFTDENIILEKMIYRIKYTEKSECEEFYEKEGLIDKNRQPVSYLCGKGWSTKDRCLWDNGMALVSNSSGWFTLVGFSLHGPGCAAPARFLSSLHYAAWIHDVTRERNEDLSDQDYINPDFRRTDGLNSEFVPIHRTFAKLGQNWTNIGRESWPEDAIVKHEYIKWPFPSYALNHFIVKPSEADEGVIHIYPFHEMFEYYDDACNSSEPKVLLYEEDFQLKARPSRTGGSVTYKISLYDLFTYGCSCVMLEMDCGPRKECDDRSEAVLAFKEVFDFTPEIDPQTSDDMVQVIPIKDHIKPYKKGDPSSRNPNLEPKYIKYTVPYKMDIPNYELYIQFRFLRTAHLKFQMYSRSSTRFGFSPEKHDHQETTDGGEEELPPRRKSMRPWLSGTVGKSIKTASEAVDGAVLETLGEARRVDATPGVVVGGCLLFCAFTRRIFV